jgi:hypothetical protein
MMGEDSVLRAFPHAVGPEKSVLSSMLQEPVEFVGLAVELGLQADHFYQPGNQLLFEEFLAKSTPISPPSGPTHWLFQGPPAESKLLAEIVRLRR